MVLQLFPSNPMLPALWAAHAFFAVLFLQSGGDKVMHYASNLSWIKEQFKNTIISSIIAPVFLFLTLLELASGISSALCLYFIGTRNTDLSLPALTLCSTTVLALFFGQRISKDYQGSAAMAGYFAVCLLSLMALSHLEM
jgi:multisubunit Na+/H+ antiporter MnhB subunit